MDYFSYRIVVLLRMFQQQNACLQFSVGKVVHLHIPWIERQSQGTGIEAFHHIPLRLHVSQLGFHQCLASQIDCHQSLLPQLQFHQLHVTCLHVQFVMPHQECLEVHPHTELKKLRVPPVGLEWLCIAHKQHMHTKEFQNWLNQRRKLIYLEWFPALQR